jgi:cytochrome c peroxidase
VLSANSVRFSPGGRPSTARTAVLGVLAVAAVIAVWLLFGGRAEAADTRRLSHACDGCPSIFRAFVDDSGKVQSAALDPSLDASNAFFSEDLGKAGQACYDCHQPRQGFTIQVPAIQASFDQTAGTDSIFATSDTANRPDADISTLQARRSAFALFLNLGIVRIGKSQAAGDFTIVPQTTAEFGRLPKPSCPNNNLLQSTDCDPQGLGATTLSVFRRPLVNTNVFFDSAVLWDGRASIDNMDGQTKRAAQTLLLSETCDTPVSPTPCTPTITPAQEHDIARFMTGVFTTQETDNAVGHLDTLGATGGIRNLLRLATNPAQPCRSAGGTLTVFTPASCTPARPPTMTLFNAWAGLSAAHDGRDTARAAVVRGQALFNGGAQLHGTVGVTSCTTCHALNNLGNNPSDTARASFVRLGLDSPEFLAKLASEDGRLASFVSRTSGLPVYSVVGATCASLRDPIGGATVVGTNLRTTDPGRALVTGECADLGAFKPPLLRNLAVRAPYFHNAAAATLDDVVDFYNARFSIHLSAQQHADLIAFLRTL